MIGFDVPEPHAIRKGQTMYYAFFAKQWEGPVELRGLEDRTYSVVNYVTGKNLRYGVRTQCTSAG
jgi:alpha-galactosidase